MKNSAIGLEDLMVELLIEENHLKRHEDIVLSDLAIIPTEEDFWANG